MVGGTDAGELNQRTVAFNTKTNEEKEKLLERKNKNIH